jgi:hypothetical protein
VSHTAQIAADYSHPGALAAAVKALGGSIIGPGRHKLYDSTRTGIGITLPKWTYPLVVEEGGILACDDFRGQWGDVSDLDRLHEEYSWALTELAAQAQGWQTERTTEGVRVYHPSGATITVTGDRVDLQGFTGGMCVEAMKQLALPLDHVQAKPAMGCVVNQCQEAE